MALVSFRLFCKNLGNLEEFFGQMDYRPPWQKIVRTPMGKTHSIRAFFFWRETEISFITKILATVGLRSHVTITLRDKSRYDLILKINETA